MNRARRDTLVNAHLGLAIAMAKQAKQHFPPSIELDDLIQQATVGLLHAAERYDPRSPVVFSVFARKRIWGAMMDANRRRHYTNATAEPLDDAAERGAPPGHDERIDAERDARRLREAVAMLPRRERTVVALYYGGRLLREIGRELSLSERRISDLHAAAITHLRRTMRANGRTAL